MKSCVDLINQRSSEKVRPLEKIAAVVCCLLILFQWQFAVAAKIADTERRPSNYVVWASADQSICEYVAKVVNAQPRQRAVEASERDTPGFAHWISGPVFKSEISGLPYYYPLTHIRADLDGIGSPKYVLRVRGPINRVETDSLYVTEFLPATTAEFESLIRSRRSDFSASDDGRIARLRKLYGAEWESWYPDEQSLVTALPNQSRPYFLAESSYKILGFSSDQLEHDSTKILVFTLDNDGARKDVCMLRRVCGCHDRSCIESIPKKDRPKLTPSKKLCEK